MIGVILDFPGATLEQTSFYDVHTTLGSADL